MKKVNLGEIKRLVCGHKLSKDRSCLLGQDLDPGPNITIHCLHFTLVCHIWDEEIILQNYFKACVFSLKIISMLCRAFPIWLACYLKPSNSEVLNRVDYFLSSSGPDTQGGSKTSAPILTTLTTPSEDMFQYPHFTGKKTETQGGELSCLKSQQRWDKVRIEALVWVQSPHYFRPPSCHMHDQLALPLTPGDVHWPLSLRSIYNFSLSCFLPLCCSFLPLPNAPQPDLARLHDQGTTWVDASALGW